MSAFNAHFRFYFGACCAVVSILAFCGALVAVFGGNLPAVLKANALAVQAWIAAAFHLFILTTSNPFVRIPHAPFEGRDLNPILQDPGLAFHPPLLYLGYVGFSIALSFAIAALLEGRLSVVSIIGIGKNTLHLVGLDD